MTGGHPSGSRLILLFILSILFPSGFTAIPRTACPPTPSEPTPPSRVDTKARVNALREQMKLRGMNVYLIPATDPHLNEYIGPDYARRKYISGFGGSQGDAVVTTDKAVLAVDSRYTTEADIVTDCDWEILHYPTESILSFLKTWTAGQKEKVIVGFDPQLISGSTYTNMEYLCNTIKCELKSDDVNLVDIIWKSRPSRSDSSIFQYPIKYSGEVWTSKVDKVRKVMKENGVNALLLTKLDEIAWLFNLRGGDIPFNPVFYSFAIIQLESLRLYLDRTPNRTNHLNSHLNRNKDNTCISAGPCVSVGDYKLNFTNDIKILMKNNDTKMWLSMDKTNHYIVSLVGRIAKSTPTPIYFMKVIKNKEESVAFQECSIIDSAAYIEFVSFLEQRMAAGEKWTELMAARKLEDIRRSYPDYHGPSFETISSSGPNAAIIHYFPTNFSDRRLSTEEIYLLDAGSQMLGCTTDITRTFHFGKPTDKMIEAYTRVLMGFIDVALSVWPQNVVNTRLEPAARGWLWKGGLNYGHGTGHGIGSFLYVHEFPNGFKTGYDNYVLQEGNFQSCEPGYYEKDMFGIRLETVLGVRPAKTKYRYLNYTFYEFFAAAFVPFEKKLINMALLREDHVNWLNNYHQQCKKNVRDILSQREKADAVRWLNERTEIIINGVGGKIKGNLHWLSCIVVLAWPVIHATV